MTSSRGLPEPLTKSHPKKNKVTNKDDDVKVRIELIEKETKKLGDKINYEKKKFELMRKGSGEQRQHPLIESNDEEIKSPNTVRNNDSSLLAIEVSNESIF